MKFCTQVEDRSTFSGTMIEPYILVAIDFEGWRSLVAKWRKVPVFVAGAVRWMNTLLSEELRDRNLFRFVEG